MDRRGHYVDNIIPERLWRSIKYEEVYLADYETSREARAGLASYLSFYNQERLHQALKNLMPAAVHAELDQLARLTERSRQQGDIIHLKRGRLTVLTNGTTIAPGAVSSFDTLPQSG